jgi:hypothetical protein
MKQSKIHCRDNYLIFKTLIFWDLKHVIFLLQIPYEICLLFMIKLDVLQILEHTWN